MWELKHGLTPTSHFKEENLEPDATEAETAPFYNPGEKKKTAVVTI